MQSKLSVIALLISIVALAMTVSANSRVESRVAAAIQAREQKFIDWLQPRLKEVFAEFDVSPYPENPGTAEEALAPLFTIIRSPLGVEP